MNILAFDTSSYSCSVALLTQDQAGTEIMHSSHQVAPKQQARLILPLIDEILANASLTLKELDVIAYGCGPGSFTGVRIASTVAQAYGLASNLPIIAISSMAAIAKAAFLAQQKRNLLVALDAHMEKVYWACYRIDEEGDAKLIGEETHCKPEMVPIPPTLSWTGIGDAWSRYMAPLEKHIGFLPEFIDINNCPIGLGVATLAQLKFAKGEGILAPGDAQPVY